jgi:alkaline phosphatase D
LTAGPTICHTTEQSTVIWYEYRGVQSDTARLFYNYILDSSEIFIKDCRSNNTQFILINPDSLVRKFYFGNTIVKAYFSNLKSDETYQIILPFKQKNTYTVRTNSNKKYTDFSFLIGSCAMTFQKPVSATYPENKIKIFNKMSKETEARFMLWTGDYTYLFKHNLKTYKTIFQRYNMQRTSFNAIDHFMSSIPQYAMWDDHDFGLDNSEGDNLLKPITRSIFRDIFDNPEPPKTEKDGIYFIKEYDDIKCIMMDGRYERNSEKPNQQMWGNTQMTWLENELKNSTHTFKFIVNGSQILTQTRKREPEALSYYPDEYSRLINFIKNEKITGVIFISGDIHSSEILKIENKDYYPFYEYTCSALTSQMTGIFHNAEVIPGYRNEKQNNYGKIRIEGVKGNRKCVLENFNYKGELIFRYTIKEGELRR